MDAYTISDSTHYLACSHCIGKNCNYYVMKCLILKTTKTGQKKILVFGERNWKNKEHIKNIRYVDKNRLTKITIETDEKNIK